MYLGRGVALPLLSLWSTVFYCGRGAFTEQFLQQVEHLAYQRELNRLEDVWHDVSTLYGLLRPPRRAGSTYTEQLLTPIGLFLPCFSCMEAL